MKKITLLLLFTLFGIYDLSAQVDHLNVVNGAATSGNGRAPQGSRNITRSVWLITAAEMTGGGFVSGDQISGLGFTYQIGQNIATTGNFTVYLENTADTANNKSTTWATAIGTMTTASNSSITIPNVAGEINYNFLGGTTFTYTGGALYVAYDYQNLVNPVATTANVAFCNNAITGGIKSALSAAGSTTAPTTTVVGNFRPVTRLGKPVTCARPYNLYSNVSTNTATSATLSYNTTSSTNVEIEYGIYDFLQGTGTTLTGISTNPYTITGLTPSTVYDVYIRTNCGGGTFSAWNGPYSFNTVFAPVTPPYNTSYEQESLSFVGWATPTLLPVAGDWATGNYGAGALVQNGLSSVVSITSTTVAANSWMFSRGFNLTAGSTVTITYYLSNFTAAPSTNTGSLDLTVGNAQTTASQTTTVLSETGITGAAFTLKTATYIPPSTGVYYFGFKNASPANVSLGTHALIVDNFSVTEALSVSDFLNSKFSLYPNPTKDLVTVSTSTDAVIYNVEVLDMNGRVVKNNKYSNVSDVQINVSDLTKGLYMLNIASDLGTVSKKLIVE